MNKENFTIDKGLENFTIDKGLENFIAVFAIVVVLILIYGLCG